MELYNFPRFAGRIEIEESVARRKCDLREGSEHILTLTSVRIPTSTGSEQSTFFIHGWMDGQPHRTELTMHLLEAGMTVARNTARLELGNSHPVAEELGRLLISRRALQYQYAPRFEAILHGPDQTTFPLISKIAGASSQRANEQRHSRRRQDEGGPSC